MGDMPKEYEDFIHKNPHRNESDQEWNERIKREQDNRDRAEIERLKKRIEDRK